MTKLALALVVTAAGFTGALHHATHRRPHPPSSATAVRTLDRASRFETRRPLPGVEKPRRAPVRHVSTSGSAPGSGALNWPALAACESSGDWHANTGNGYYGGLQMNLGFWRTYGGLRFAGRPDLASRVQQITVAVQGFRARGREPWPRCGVHL